MIMRRACSSRSTLPFASSKRRRDAASQVVIDGDPSITCSYIPTHLEYIVFEILKARIQPERRTRTRHIAHTVCAIPCLAVSLRLLRRLVEEGPAPAHAELMGAAFSPRARRVGHGEYARRV